MKIVLCCLLLLATNIVEVAKIGGRCPFAPQTNARYCPKHMPRDEKKRAK